jgi:hypothetical protein
LTLIGAAEAIDDELMFDASTIVERVENQQRSGQSDVREKSPEEVSATADALLQELHESGFDLGPFGGAA